MIGRTISQYHITEKLGGGGMGVVYKATDQRLDRTVALKFLPPHLGKDPDANQRFVQEAKAASALDHANICTIHDIAETDDGQLFIVMAYYQGQTLKYRLADGLSIDESVEIAIQIAEGLERAHEAGIVHRDVKPANLMVTDRGEVKILDFGVAKLGEGGALTQAGSAVGTTAYMSPEQARGEAVDGRTDVWALGVVLYEMLTGERPFRGDYDQAVIYSILNQEPEPLREVHPEVPEALAEVVDRALQKDADARYPSVAALKADLEALSSSTSPTLQAMPATEPSAMPTQLSGKWVVLAILAVVLAAGAYVIGAALNRESTSEAADTPALEDARPMIVILPFDNLGPPDVNYFATGIADEITSRLSRVHNLGVISRNSAQRYAETNKTIAQIGEELGVDYILDGTVRWAGETEEGSRVRITPQLIRVADDTQLWSEPYDRVLDDIFEIQSDIALQVVDQLNVTLQEKERQTLAARPTDNVEAFQAYLRGVELYWTDTEPEIQKLAAQMFERAVQQDPDFALAYTWLAQTYALLARDTPPDERLAHAEQAKIAVDRARALQPDLPEVHRALGWYYYHALADYDRGLAEFALAAKDLPDNVEILWGIGAIYRRQGKLEESLVQFERSFERDPRVHMTATLEIGNLYQALRQYAKAAQYYDQQILLMPDQPRHYVWKANNSLAWTGSVARFRSILEQRPGPGNTYDHMRQWVRVDHYEKNFGSALARLAAFPAETLDASDKAEVLLLTALSHHYLNDRDRARAAWDTLRVFVENVLAQYPENHGGSRIAAHLRTRLAYAYAGLGRAEEALREGQAAVAAMAYDAWWGPQHQEHLARIHVLLGDYEAALDLLEHLLSISYDDAISTGMLHVDPAWDPLREHPRFQQLLKTYSPPDQPAP